MSSQQTGLITIRTDDMETAGELIQAMGASIVGLRLSRLGLGSVIYYECMGLMGLGVDARGMERASRLKGAWRVWGFITVFLLGLRLYCLRCTLCL